LIGLFLISGLSLKAQFHSKEAQRQTYSWTPERNSTKQSWLAQQKRNAFQPPMFTALGALPFTNKSSYWLSQITTQTMHDGKMGTFYMWDQQGNLRESRFFMDIGGNRRPGLKLVFPRR
jgi:hypothetical protein